MELKKWIACMMAGVLMLSGIAPGASVQAAKKKMSLNKKVVTLYKGKTVKLKVKNAKKKVKWSSNKKKVATVSQKGLVKAKKKGKAKITAKVGKKKFTCVVTVKVRPTTKPSSSPTGDGTEVDPTKDPSGGSSTDNPSTTDNPSATDSPKETESPSPTDAPSKDATLSAPTMLGSLSVGMTDKEVEAKFGTPGRTDDSPLGFTVSVYSDSKAMMMVSYDSGKVVGFFGMGIDISYGTVLASGTTLSTLSGDSSWSDVSWYRAQGLTQDNQTATFQKVVDDVRVLAFTDYFASGQKVFAIQVFSKEYTVDTIAKPNKKLKYSDKIVSDMDAEIFTMLNVYRSMHGGKPFAQNTGMNTVAKAGSQALADNGSKDVVRRTNQAILDAMFKQKLDPDKYEEYVAYGSIDAIGFTMSYLQTENSRSALFKKVSGQYVYDKMGVGCVCVGEGVSCKNYLTVDFAWEDPNW